MFFSIIIPCFNSEKTIVRTLSSVKKQTFKDYELVIVDDGSIDLTAKIIKEFCEKNDLEYTYIYQENHGPATARNNAAKNSKGNYLAFLDADDAWHKDKLKVQYELIKKYDANFITTDYTVDSFKDINTDNYRVSKFTFNSFLLSNKTSTPCTVVLKELFEKSGEFPENQRYSEDYSLWLNISYHEPLYKIHLPLVSLHKHPYGYTGLSANLFQMEKYELKNYVSLRKSGKINIFTLIGLIGLSLVKFLRRMILVSFRKN